MWTDVRVSIPAPLDTLIGWDDPRVLDLCLATQVRVVGVEADILRTHVHIGQRVRQVGGKSITAFRRYGTWAEH
jgi:hypothetical protein